jgi:hypothetical protein
MINLSNVTLISLAGVNYNHAVRAIENSQNGIKFYDSKILTPEKPTYLPSKIKWEKTPPLRLRGEGIDDYSQYFLYEIWKHIDTDFCLVVQGDGFVINPNSWTNEFLDYDYIGAPWPKSKTSYIDPFGNHQQVGNGGFSLRSRKLLYLPQEVDIPWEVNNSSFYRQFGERGLAEDGNISVHNKHLFEAAGCKYAGVKLAARFAQEMPVPEGRGIKPFGFHKYPIGKSKLKLLRHGKAWLPNYLGMI